RVSSLQPPPTTELYTLSHTTLFRSGQLEPAAYPAGAPPGHDAAGSHPAGGIANRGRAGLLRQSPGSPDLAGRRGRKRAAVAAEADRKSTRLNSSHVKISYAVFCLKK